MDKEQLYFWNSVYFNIICQWNGSATAFLECTVGYSVHVKLMLVGLIALSYLTKDCYLHLLGLCGLKLVCVQKIQIVRISLHNQMRKQRELLTEACTYRNSDTRE
jgi:hypothetical protein